MAVSRGRGSCRSLAIVLTCLLASGVAGCAHNEILEADATTTTEADDVLILGPHDTDRETLDVPETTDVVRATIPSGRGTAGPVPAASVPIPNPTTTAPVPNLTVPPLSGQPPATSAAPPPTAAPKAAVPTPPTTAPRAQTTTTTSPPARTNPELLAALGASANDTTTSNRSQTVLWWAQFGSTWSQWRLTACSGVDYRATASGWLQVGWRTSAACNDWRLVLGVNTTRMTRSLPSSAVAGNYRYCVVLEEIGANGLTGRLQTACVPYRILP